MIGDSHTRDMDTAIKASHPNVEIMLVTKLRDINQITNHFMTSGFQPATAFNPTWIVIHCGHNDIVYHKLFNKNPQFARQVAIQQVQLALNIQTSFPHARVLCSRIYPRTASDSSNLDPVNTAAYNRAAKRYGTRLRTLTTPHNIRCSMNNVLWRRISKTEEAADQFRADGLHLTENGKQRVGNEWIQVITQP